MASLDELFKEVSVDEALYFSLKMFTGIGGVTMVMMEVVEELLKRKGICCGERRLSKRPLCAETTCSFKNPSDRITVAPTGKFQADWTCLKGPRVGQGKRAKSRGDTEDPVLRSAGPDWPRPDPIYLPWRSCGEPTQKQSGVVHLWTVGEYPGNHLGSCHFTKKFHRFVKLSKPSADPDPQRSQPASLIGPLG
ncbi:hypothetical protein NE237_032356 [Protea cynaroides]|uniref:Uncharacterized protein n=1 Tax=Protea cynaroides TaxID=273540 RepID=A0A9Q0L439_9MAGN|nr:hypothetical protein NE237_032356 [Protea cynaroides]